MNTEGNNGLIHKIIVRDYRDEDYQGLKLLWEATGLDDPRRGDDRETIARTLEQGGKLFIAILPGGKLIASAWVTSDGRRLHLHHVGVLPEFQRKGIGRFLSVRSIEFARQKQLQLKLEVHRSNKPAVDLYRSLGFSYLGDYDVYIMRSF